MDCPKSSQSVLEPELYFLIARFLSGGPCQRTVKILLEELEQFKLLPRRVDWEGNEHFRSYENLVYLNRHIRSDHLLRIVDRVGTLVDKEVKSSVPGVRSLLGAGSLSILRTAEDLKHTKWGTAHHTIKQHGSPLCPPSNLAPPAVSHVVQAYQMAGTVRQHSMLPTSMYSKISMHGRKLGHLSAVYCVLFDRTGNYIFTGADDALVKIWSTFDMRLLATLRGHSAEITDMAVSFENTYLASGSCDKIVRVWCLSSKAPVAVLQGHSSMITSVQFCPKINGNVRYLVSTGNDGCVCFWHYNIISNVFSPKPLKFIEKSRAGAQMLCSSFSPGGAFLATGNSDHVIRVYFLHPAGPEKICELEAHTDKVDSICYSNHQNRFISGSNDGTARIWKFEKHEWRATVLSMSAAIQNFSATARYESRTEQIRVTMVSWTMDDSKVITADSNLIIKIWNSYTGTLLQMLEGHEDEVYVLEACPADCRILLSAGHDGKMIIWDIVNGTKIKKFFNLIEGQGHGGMFDGKFAPDGQSVAATDSHGHMLVLGFGTNDRCKKLPQQLFFHTDYRPLMRDANNFVLDEQTQQPPHLMPPPFLVDIDGNPYPAHIQRCVPGRENCKESSLIPQMAVNAEGEPEVIGQENDEDDSETEEDEEEADEGTLAEGNDVRAGAATARLRPSIDILIQELQRRQDQERAVEPGPSGDAGPSSTNQLSPIVNGGPRSPSFMTSPTTPRSNMQNRIGMRRSGEIEGVRQSLSQVSVRSTKKERDALKRRVIVKPLDGTALQLAEQKRLAYSEEESKKFLAERRKHTLSPNENNSSSTANKGRRQTKKKSNDLAEPEVTARNRLTTRALYDTEEEEDEGGGSDVDMYASESNSSDDYSDWVGDQGSSNLEPPKRRSQRTIKRRRLSSSDEDVAQDEEEENDDEDTEDSKDSSSDEESSNEKIESSPEKPAKSSRREIRQKNVSKKTPTSPRKKKSKVKKDKPEIPTDIPIDKELDEKMRPPEWITTVIPRKAPFVPQMGDEVIYFRQGHEQYLQAVLRKEVYEVEIDRNQPWHKIPQLRAHELVKIVGIKWLLKPIRLCCLKLAFMDTNSGKLTGKSFTIKYHDMPDVIDFLVLKQHYDISVERGWKPGTKFRSMIDDQWWIGVIRSQEPFGASFPDSLYQCFNVHWDNGEFEKLSPWDMEPVDSKRKPSKVGGGVNVTPEEYKQLLYAPKKTEWTSIGREAESERLISGMETLMQHSFAEPFIAPVDLQQFPTYAHFVAYPMDLSTIKARLENGFYRRITALQWDIRLIYANAIIFNEPRSNIVKNASVLTEALLRFIKDHSCVDLMPLLNELSREGVKTGSSDEDDSQSSPKKMTDSPRKKRKLSKSKAQPNPDAWLESAESLLAMMFECEDSEPFRIPVDPNLYPDYEDIVSSPMDLTTVHTKLACAYYGNPVDLSKDMRLIFSNSKLFNTNKRSRIYSMTLRLSALFEDQISQIITRWKSALRASGRLDKLKKKSDRSRHSKHHQPHLSWNGSSEKAAEGQPCTSKDVHSSKKPILANGHGAGSGEDSDATIVDKQGSEDDGGETEVYEEELKGKAWNKTRELSEEEEEVDSDNDDGDYRPSRRPSKGKGKFSKRGKGKSSKALPSRAVSGRRSKSNIFYASDDNHDDDDVEFDDEEIVNFKERKKKKNHVHDFDDKISSDEGSDGESQPGVKFSSKKSTSRSKNCPKERLSPKKSSMKSRNIPSHRKARGVRSGNSFLDSDDEVSIKQSVNKSSRGLKRSVRSARMKKKYYQDGDSEDEDNNDKVNVSVVSAEETSNDNSDQESSSSPRAAEDSDDELLQKDEPSDSENNPSSQQGHRRRRVKKQISSEDSDSDVPVPRKRVRLKTPPKSNKQPIGLSNCAASKRIKGKKGGNKKMQTRNRGQQKVTYLEDDTEEDLGGGEDIENNNSDKNSDSEDDSPNPRNVSSRGRVRKITARAKACFKNL